MADAEAVNAVAAGSIEAINGVAKASIQAINGAGLPAAGASLWCIVGADGAVATAAGSDLNDWTGYVAAQMGSPASQDWNEIAYGEDGSGGPMWVAVNSNNLRDIRWNADPTAGIDSWGNKNPTNTMLGVTWSDGVWLAVGANGAMWRSTTGSGSWTEIDLSGVTDWASENIYEVIGNGAGSFMFAQGMNVFLSTDAGETFAPVVDFTDAAFAEGGSNLTGYTAYTMAYTAGRWSVFLQKSGQTRLFHAAAADTSTWTVAQDSGGAVTGTDLLPALTNTRMAAAGGTVVIVCGNDVTRSTDGGQNFTRANNSLPRLDARDIATDGQENWVVVHDSGRVSVSTDDGVNWTEQSGGQLTFPSSGANIENLDAVAASVTLPL